MLPIKLFFYHLYFSCVDQVLLFFCRTSKIGTFAIWTPSWIPLNMKVASLSRELIHPTCTLACGRPPLHGTLRTWTSTVLTTCTLESPNHGKNTNCLLLDKMQNERFLFLHMLIEFSHSSKMFRSCFPTSAGNLWQVVSF